MPRWALAATWAATVALLAAGVGAAVVEQRQGRTTGNRPATASTSPTPSSSPATPAPPTSSTPPPGQAGTGMESVVPALQAFVERERGLSFKRPVKVALLADGPFEARLGDSDEEDLKELQDAQAVLRAMGLLGTDIDLVAAVRRFSAGAVLGFYDTEDKELVVRGAEPTAFVRAVLVHELTHALEDQNFDLDRSDLGDEAYLGFQALVEGSAIRIEERYRRSLSARERAQARRDEASRSADVPDDLPLVLKVAFGFPYAYGPGLVQAVVRAGGQARLDAAYADPPASTEQVLDPARYLDGDEPRPVPVPRSDGAAFDDGEIGQLFLMLMLQAELDDEVAREAAEGWGGDRYVAWREGGRTCVRMDFVMDAKGDTTELAEALARWAGERPRTASSSGTSLRTCG